MKKEYIIAGVLILAILIFFASYPFFFVFRNGSFSKQSSDWANSATWIGLYVSLVTTGLIIYLTWRIHKNESKREDENHKFVESLERPVCVFVTKEINKENGYDKWWIQNVGRGAALNLHIGFFENSKTEWDEDLVKGYSLQATSELELKWLHKKQCRKLVAFYDGDVSNKKIYCTIGEGDHSFIVDKETKKNDSIIALSKRGMMFKNMKDLSKYPHIMRKQEAEEKYLS